MIKIGIVGSRWRSERRVIRNILLDCIERYNDNFMVISGGAIGIDTEVEEECKDLNIVFEKDKYLPNLENIKDYFDATSRYYTRNKLIGKDADYLHAFPLHRRGGTMNAVKYFLQTHNENKLKIID